MGVSQTKRIRMCAVCTKEPVTSKVTEEMKEEERKNMEEKITEEIVTSSGRMSRLTLRDKKTIERKLQRHFDEGKEKKGDNLQTSDNLSEDKCEVELTEEEEKCTPHDTDF